MAKRVEDLRKEAQALEEREKRRILMYKITHPGSEILPDKHMVEQMLAIKLQMEKVKKETRNAILAELHKIDLNVATEPEKDASWTHNYHEGDN